MGGGILFRSHALSADLTCLQKRAEALFYNPSCAREKINDNSLLKHKIEAVKGLTELFGKALLRSF